MSTILYCFLSGVLAFMIKSSIVCVSAIIAHDEFYQYIGKSNSLGIDRQINVHKDTREATQRLQAHFSVYWNVPTQHCLTAYGISVDVAKYGIITNLKDGWAGENITIFPRPGLYPEVNSGVVIHGGIPQNVLLDEHISRLRDDIDASIPDEKFRGLAVIDYEGWQPLWSLNFDTREIYRNMSIELVQRQHPEWTKDKIRSAAEKQFQDSARKFLDVTIRTAQAYRPGGRWGYYHYPYCFSRDDVYPENMMTVKCQQFARADNDRLLWLFQSEDVLFPSAYLVSDVNATFNDDVVRARLGEAKRVQKMLSSHGTYTPMYMYSTFLYKKGKHFYSKVDLGNTIKKALVMGLDGVVLWGDHNLSNNKTICSKVKQYVDVVLGPFVQRLSKHSR